MNADLSVVLLHDDMVNKQGERVTTSLTMIDSHDIARSCATYGVKRYYIAHSSAYLRSLARTLQEHWKSGFGSTYNPNRQTAISITSTVSSLDDAIADIEQRTGALPRLVATSAKDGPDRISCESFRTTIQDGFPTLLMLGTGSGMSDSLLERAPVFLAPINGPTPYNHLSVRSACAILLDRLLGC